MPKVGGNYRSKHLGRSSRLREMLTRFIYVSYLREFESLQTTSIAWVSSARGVLPRVYCEMPGNLLQFLESLESRWEPMGLSTAPPPGPHAATDQSSAFPDPPPPVIEIIGGGTMSASIFI